MELQSIHFEKSKILIVGDVMLDQYCFGGTSRISPEAPVPVVLVDHMDERPGGAANVALGVQALGAVPTLLGVVGADAPGAKLKKILEDCLLDCRLQHFSECHTITKLRVLSRNQQMMRLDTEKRFSKEVGEALKAYYLDLLQDKDAVVISDYDKGTLSDPAWFIQAARAKNIPVIVDPKARDCSVYQKATVIKPNLKEFEAIVGPCPNDEILVKKAFQFLEDYEIESLVISRSEKGLSVITRKGSVTHIAAEAREVHDVTGAGDTVVAVLAAALAVGMDLVKAATLGNVAAGIAVGKLGAAKVTLQEIKVSLGKEEHQLPLGIMTEEALMAAVQISKARGERIIFTNGCFDILHAGHVMYLEQAKRLGDRVIVAVNTDASVARLKGPTRPVNKVEERMAVLAGLRSVDWVVPFSEDTPERIIQKIAPHILVKGGDYQDITAIPGARFVLTQGGKVQLLGLKAGCSTTNVINTIAAQRESVVV